MIQIIFQNSNINILICHFNNDNCNTNNLELLENKSIVNSVKQIYENNVLNI